MKVYSLQNITAKKERLIPMSGLWLDAIGEPEPFGTWFIFGQSKNGKTSFAMQIAKLLSPQGKALYNSIEEGLSTSTKRAVQRAGIDCRFLLATLNFEELKKYLLHARAIHTVFIDSVQFMELTFEQYKFLKTLYPNKLFIYISHIQGNQPDGQVARRIMRDANVIFRVEGFRAFPTSRYGGGAPIDVAPELAQKYWLSKS